MATVDIWVEDTKVVHRYKARGQEVIHRSGGGGGGNWLIYA